MKPIHLQIRTIIVWAVSLVLCLSAGGTIVHLWARRGVVREREQELIALQKENRDLEGAFKETQGEAYVERMARDKLGMIRDGETIVIMPDREPNSDSGSKAEAVPNWKKWWRLFY